MSLIQRCPYISGVSRGAPLYPLYESVVDNQLIIFFASGSPGHRLTHLSLFLLGAVHSVDAQAEPRPSRQVPNLNLKLDVFVPVPDSGGAHHGLLELDGPRAPAVAQRLVSVEHPGVDLNLGMGRDGTEWDIVCWLGLQQCHLVFQYFEHTCRYVHVHVHHMCNSRSTVEPLYCGHLGTCVLYSEASSF